MTTVGLALIIIAWGLQLSSVLQKNNKIQPSFIIVYALGVLLLAIDGFNSGLVTIASLNLLSMFVALGVVYKLGAKKR